MSYVVIAQWIAGEGTEEDVEDALCLLAADSRREQGCMEYRVHQSVDDPHRYLLYELYTDAAAYEAHLESDHFREHALERAIPLLTSRERQYFRFARADVGAERALE